MDGDKDVCADWDYCPVNPACYTDGADPANDPACQPPAPENNMYMIPPCCEHFRCSYEG